LALIGVRPLAAKEVDILQAERRRLTRQGWLWLAVVGSVAVLLPLIGTMMHQVEILGDLWATWIVIGLPACAIGANLAFRARKTVRQELEDGTAKEFGTNFDSPPVLGQPQIVENLVLLSATHRLWRMNGLISTKKWEIMPVATVAETSEFANIAAQWLRPAQIDANLEVLFGRREMSSAEIGELRRVVRTFLVKFAPPTLLFNLWFGGTAIASIVRHEMGHGWAVQSFVLMGVVTLALNYSVIKLTLSALKLRRDAQGGEILILREETKEDIARGQPTQEILPHSKWLWTTDGVPAPWRTSGVFSKKR